MIRHSIALFLVILLLPLLASARPGGAPVPACTATAPSQATAASFTNLAFCDSLSNTQTIDVSNTRASGFKWYWPLFSTDTAPAAASNKNDGTGAYVEPATETSMTTASGNPSGGSYTGKVFGGGFYAEASMKWNATSGCSLWPVFWFQSVNLINSSPTFPNHEIDVFEFLSCNTTPGANVYERTTNSTTGYGNSNNATSIGGSPNFTQYHKYGVLWQTQAQTGGGAGVIKFYFDDVLQSSNTVTYVTGGAPSPSTCRGPALYSGSVTCPSGTFSTIDTDQMALVLNYSIPNNSSNRAVYKDVHVWQTR